MKRCLVLGALMATAAFGATLSGEFETHYSVIDLGVVPGLPTSYGALLVDQGNTNVLLIGGAADGAGGVIETIALTRDAEGHITGFSGTASLFSTAPGIDGGLAYAPNGTLLYTAYDHPKHKIGQIKPGSSSPDKVVDAPGPISVGTIAFIPAGFPGAGSFVVGSYNADTFCTSSLTEDGSGTYDVGPCTVTAQMTGGPEGIVYIPFGSPGFSSPSVLVSEYFADRISTYTLDANGLPNPGSRQDFITGIDGAMGATIDPVTGDFLFSTFGGGDGSDHVIAVRGFAAPMNMATPEPASFLGLGFGLACLAVLRFRRVRNLS